MELILIKQNYSQIPDYLTPDELVELFSVAVYFVELRIVENIIVTITANAKNADQVIQIMLLREDHTLPTFDTTQIYKFIDMNFHELVESALWPRLDIRYLRKILNRRTLHIRNELQIINGKRSEGMTQAEWIGQTFHTKN